MNLFHCYGARDAHGKEKDTLCEDNLTRAFIHTLRLLAGRTRNTFLRCLFQKSRHLSRLDYTDAAFNLQGYMNKDQLVGMRTQVIVTISSHSGVPKAKSQRKQGSSTPDAWIYNADKDYCILIEDKVGSNPVDTSQIRDHARWFGSSDDESAAQEKRAIPVSLTWNNVLEAIRSTRTVPAGQKEDGEGGTSVLSRQEELILDDFAEYIGFYGYWLFEPFRYEIDEPPEWELYSR